MLLTGLVIVLTVPVSLVIGLPMIVVGGATAAWAYAHVRRRSARARAERPVPLHPRVSSVRLLERLRTRIDLGPQGDYLIRATQSMVSSRRSLHSAPTTLIASEATGTSARCLQTSR